MRFYLFGVLVLGLASCSTVDTGMVDFRRADPVSTTGVDLSCPADGTTKVCPPLSQADLRRKSLRDPDRSIAKSSFYSIRLDSALIADMSEWQTPMIRNRPDFQTNGEIVILARAFELSDDDGQPKRFLDFQTVSKTGDGTITGGFDEAKVIYFNPDVDEGQYLSFSNIPILGPVQYDGGPVGLQIIVLELDRMGKSVKGLLETMAALGRTYAVPGEALDTLLQLGAGMLQNSSDDVIFEYRMIMDGGETIRGDQIVSSFERGRLVFRRSQNRQNSFVWRNLILDENTGHLMTKTSSPTYKDYKEETYFVVNVIDHGKDGPPGAYEFKKWSTLSNEYTAYLDQETQFIQSSLTPIIAELAENRISLAHSNKLSAALETLRIEWESYGRRALVPAAIQSLPSNHQMGADAQNICNAVVTAVAADISTLNGTLSGARGGAINFLMLLNEANTPVVGGTKSPLKDEEKTVLMGRLRTLFYVNLASDDEDMATYLGSFDAFQAQFLGNGQADAFIAQLKASAKNTTPENCSEVKQTYASIWATQASHLAEIKKQARN